MITKDPDSIKGQIKNIIFDFGGVLFNIDYHAPIAAFKAMGFENFEAIYTQASQSKIFDQLEVGELSNEDFLNHLQQLIPVPVSHQQILDAWNVILLDIPKKRIDFVLQLRDRYRTFLLSNTNAIHVGEFEKVIDQTMGLDHYRSAFEHIYYSNVLGLKKPYPETYLQVCALHGLNPKETLFIDDSAQHVHGAAKAGLHAYHLELPESEITEILSNW